MSDNPNYNFEFFFTRKFLLFLPIFLFFVPLINAELFGYGHTAGADGTTNINNTYNNITNNYYNTTFNSTQFDGTNPAHLNETWLTSFINTFNFLTSWLLPDTTNGYLYNDSTKFYFNDTKLNSSFLSLSGGTMTGNINMGSKNITNVTKIINQNETRGIYICSSGTIIIGNTSLANEVC